MKKIHPIKMMVAISAVFSLLLFAVDAQAEVTPLWNVLGSQLTSAKEVSATVTEELKFNIPSKETEFRCSKIALDDGLLLTAGQSSATLLLTGCSTYLGNTLFTSCKPAEPITAKIKGSLLHESTSTELISPAEGSTLTTLKFSEPCPLPSEASITGSAVIGCVEAACEKEQATHIVSSAPGDGLSYEGHPVELAGKVTMELMGTDKGSPWGVFLLKEEGEGEGNWRIKGANITKSIEATGSLENEFSLSMSFGANSVKVSCASLAVSGGSLQIKGASTGTLSFTKCQTLINGKLAAECKPIEPIVAGFKGLLVAHKKTTYIVISSASEGSPLTKLKFNEEECVSLFPSMSITGSVVFECVKASCSTEEESHLVLPASAALFPEHALVVGSNPITLEGSGIISLIGTEKGKLWSGLAK